MLPPLLGFLAVACIAFFVCVAVPPLRRFALGTAFWLAAVAVLLPAAFFVNVAAVGLLTEKHLHAHIPLNAYAVKHVESIALINAIGILLVASIACVAHGFIVRRVTLALFRLYVAIVTVAVAVTLAWVSYLIVSVVTGSNMLGALVAIASLTLAATSIVTWRDARQFRAARPQWLQPISVERYESNVHET
jgi:hypothetical protein